MYKNDIFLKTKAFGNLYFKDCISYYEYPRIFICRTDTSNTLFLFYEMKSGGSFDEWLVAKISNDEYWNLFSRRQSVQDLYKKKEGGSLWTIRNTYGIEKDITEAVNDGSRCLLSLPNKDIFPE